MEVTLIIIGFAILIFLIIKQKEEISELRKGLAQTFDQLIGIKSLLEQVKTKGISASITEEETVEHTAQEEVPEVLSELEAPTIEEEPLVQEEPAAVYEHEIVPPPIPVETISPTIENVIPDTENKPEPQPIAAEERLSWFEQFKRNNPDIEKFIGENLINKIGIVILVLGISFFVKYAIDKDWINEPTRVGIGILCGGILLGVAHRLRLLYKAFSSVLVAGAIAVFYFTIGIGFHDYAIFSQTTAFILMIMITVFSVFVSVLYDRQELGVLSFIGGFAVPFMVSTGNGNYHVLFTYLAILNVGMLTVSYYKRWFIVNFTAFVLTTVLFAGWYVNEQYKDTPLVLQNGFVYCTLFYVLFSIAFILNNVVRKNKFANYEIAALITNTAAYYAVGHHLFQTTLPQYVGLYTILLGVYNMIFAFIIYKKYQFDRNIIYVLIGLALTLATITIPVQFEGNYITLFWACEAVLLFWLTHKSQLKGFTFAGIIVQGLAIISLLMDLTSYLDETVAHTLGFNIVFLTGLVVIGSLVYTYRLFHQYDYNYTLAGVTLNPVSYRKYSFNLAILLGYILPLIEIAYQTDAYFNNIGTIYIFLYLYHMLYTTALLVLGNRQMSGYSKWSKFIAVFNMILYILIAYRIPLMEKQDTFYDVQATFPYAMLLHYISLACLLYQTWLFVKASIKDTAQVQFKKSFTPWFVAFFIVYVCSTEINIGFLFSANDWETYFNIKNFVIKVIFPILWGILSFAFLIVGIRLDQKPTRIIALTLLGLTILKLFIYDIRDVSETGKIVAFILLGVVILVISFVYQKIKKLIVNDHEKTIE